MLMDRPRSLFLQRGGKLKCPMLWDRPLVTYFKILQRDGKLKCPMLLDRPRSGAAL